MKVLEWIDENIEVGDSEYEEEEHMREYLRFLDNLDDDAILCFGFPTHVYPTKNMRYDYCTMRNGRK